MYILFTFLVLIYFSIQIDAHDIEILGSGLGKIHENNLLMVFYVTVRHNGIAPQRIILKMSECCELVMDGDTDCNVIDLYGSYIDHVEPKGTKNMTLYYPNLYGYNRKGYCLVNLQHRPTSTRDFNMIRHKINFDTFITSHSVPSPLHGLYRPQALTACDTPDLDPFDNCNPVICSLKYSGYRNYFNRKIKRCQKVPICLSNRVKELPDIVYVPTINTCRNVANAVTEDDISDIMQGITESNNFEDQMVNIRCHHGEIDTRTGLCICDYGWKSEPFDPDVYNPHTVYSMCNVKCYPTSKSRSGSKILYHMIGIFVALWLASCVVCFEAWGVYCKLKKKFECKVSDKYALYFSVKEEDAEEEMDSCQHEANGLKAYPETVCNMCHNQCPRTMGSDYSSNKTGDDRTLWDISRERSGFDSIMVVAINCGFEPVKEKDETSESLNKNL